MLVSNNKHIMGEKDQFFAREYWWMDNLRRHDSGCRSLFLVVYHEIGSKLKPVE